MKTRKQTRQISDDEEDYEEDYCRTRAIRSCRTVKRRKRNSPRILQIDSESPETPDQPVRPHSLSRTPPSAKSRKTNGKSSNPKVASDTCNFCGTKDAEVYELGEFKKCEDITAHMYCLFFAPGLTQNGELNEGIDGFLLADIRREIRRASLLKCTYCGKKCAPVGCAVTACSSNFHLPCGIQNGAFTQFHDPNHSYPAWCKKHRPKISIPSFKGQRLCTICQENVKYTSDRANLLYLSCCQTYFHRSCSAQLAYHLGEFNLNCPNCKNDEVICETLKKNGINVPCRDALPDASPELNGQPPNDLLWECRSPNCRCEFGRNHNGDNEWELFACDLCGSNAVHMACAGLSEGSEWVCDICSNVR